MVFYSQIFERLPHGISEYKKVEGYGLIETIFDGPIKRILKFKKILSIR